MYDNKGFSRHWEFENSNDLTLERLSQIVPAIYGIRRKPFEPSSCCTGKSSLESSTLNGFKDSTDVHVPNIDMNVIIRICLPFVESHLRHLGMLR